jgi:hypothetical protein
MFDLEGVRLSSVGGCPLRELESGGRLAFPFCHPASRCPAGRGLVRHG